MARTLDTNLTNAVNGSIKAPSLSVQIADKIPHFVSYQNPATQDSQHSACIANDGSIVRARVTRGGTGFDQTLQVQRITDPSIAGQWSTWSNLSGANIFQDGGVAIVNDTVDNVLRVFAARGTGGNQIFYWESSNNGASWGTNQTATTPPGGALTKGIASTGNNECWFIYDVAGGESLGLVAKSGGVWGGIDTSTLPTIAQSGGLAVALNAGKYTIVYSDSYTLYQTTWQVGHEWVPFPTVASAASTAIGRLYPHISFFDGVYHLTCTEVDSGTLTGITYAYTRVRESTDLIHWSNGWIMHVLPTNFGALYLKLLAPQTGSSGARYYYFTTPGVYSAVVYNSGNANQFLDVSARVLMFKRMERGEKPAEFEVVLDNTNGALNGLIYDGSGSTTDSSTTFEPISYNATLSLNEGYLVGGPPPTTPDTVNTGTYRIAQYLLERTPEENQVRIHALDQSRELDTQCRWQKTYTNETVAWFVAEIAARAGVLKYSVQSTSNTSQIVPTFVLHAGQTYRAMLNDLCNTYGLWYFMDQGETLQFVEKSGSDPIVWSYQPEWEVLHFGAQDMRSNHIIVSGKPPSVGSAFSITEGEAYDDNHQRLVMYERLIHHTDQKLTTTAQCNAKATALMAEEQRLEAMHSIQVPVNPALQMYDGITITDYAAPTGSGRTDNCRIIQSIVQFDAQTATYEQHLALEGL